MCFSSLPALRLDIFSKQGFCMLARRCEEVCAAVAVCFLRHMEIFQFLSFLTLASIAKKRKKKRKFDMVVFSYSFCMRNKAKHLLLIMDV